LSQRVCGFAIREFQKTFVPIFVNLPPESMIPMANLLPVSNLPPVSNFPLDTSGNLPLVSMTLVVNLPPVSATTLVVHLELRIFPQIFKKVQMALMGYSGAWEKLIHEKT
jgi:hypothetical protein